jgi:hypothetical protein
MLEQVRPQLIEVVGDLPKSIEPPGSVRATKMQAAVRCPAFG